MTQNTNDSDVFFEYLKEMAGNENEPTRHAARVVLKRLERNLVQKWPDLFKLYQHPDGSWEVDFEVSLEQRRRRLEEGITSDDKEVSMCLESLECMIAAIQLRPLERIPTIGDIPFPERSDSVFGFNIIEIHKAATDIFNKSIGSIILGKTIQDTIAPRVEMLLEGTLEERQAAAKSLKKSLSRAIDILAQVDAATLPHGNKPLFKDLDSKLKPLSVIVIDTARALVKENKALPTKAELRERVRQDLPNVHFSDRKWPDILKEAGLEKLPSKVPFRRKE